MKLQTCRACGKKYSEREAADGVIVCKHCGLKQLPIPRELKGTYDAEQLQKADSKLAEGDRGTVASYYGAAGRGCSYYKKAHELYFRAACYDHDIMWYYDERAKRSYPVCRSVQFTKLSEDAYHRLALCNATPAQKALIDEQTAEIDGIIDKYGRFRKELPDHRAYIVATPGSEKAAEDVFNTIMTFAEAYYAPISARDLSAEDAAMLRVYALAVSEVFIVVDSAGKIKRADDIHDDIRLFSAMRYDRRDPIVYIGKRPVKKLDGTELPLCFFSVKQTGKPLCEFMDRHHEDKKKSDRRSSFDGICYANANALRGIADGYAALAFKFFCGEELVQSYERAAELGEAAVGNGDRKVGARVLGECLHLGAGVKKDRARARRLLELAGENGDGRAAFLAGEMCIEEGDNAGAVKWFTIASDLGYTAAHLRIRLLYLYGEGVKKNEKKAVEYFTRGNGSRDADCGLLLAACYHDGIGAEKNWKTAEFIYKVYAEKDNVEAQYALAMMYMYGGHGLVASPYACVRWMEKAAKREYKDSMYYMAVFYANGLGVKQDAAKAAEWYDKAKAHGETRKIIYSPKPAPAPAPQKAKEPDPSSMSEYDYIRYRAEHGDAEAMYDMGTIAYYGRYGRGIDYYEAFSWFRRSSDAGFWHGMYGMSVCYSNGFGVEQNDKLADYWYERSMVS